MSNTNGWKKRFEEMNKNCDAEYGCGQFPPEIKRFVEKELADARREVIEKLEAMIDERTEYPSRVWSKSLDSVELSIAEDGLRTYKKELIERLAALREEEKK